MLYLFLKNWGSVLTAIVVIPVSVLATVVVMLAAKLTFNLMTLGGIAAAIGLIIDDAIVVVEAIYARVAHGEPRFKAIQTAMRDIMRPLLRWYDHLLRGALRWRWVTLLACILVGCGGWGL